MRLSRRNRMDRNLLRGFEPYSISLLESLNTSLYVKAMIHDSLCRFNAWWITACTSRLWQVHGLDALRGLEAPRGTLLVSNHRSFFDMYFVSSLLVRHTKLMRRLYFPVRSDFFYSSPIGVLINLAMSGGSMWPPVFRDRKRFRLNVVGLRQLGQLLRRGTVVGYHPEGRRNRDGAPHELLPVRKGIGNLIRSCPAETLVIPCFVVGLTNRFMYEITRSFHPTDRRGVPVRMWFGDPALAGDLCNLGNPQEIADAVREMILALAHRDRAALTGRGDAENGSGR